jgi:zinc protease
VAIAYPTLARSDPDYYALETANLILGRLGLMGRLGASVRDEQGLAYYVYSTLDSGREQSLWNARAGVDPKDVERAIDGIRVEVERLQSEPVSEDELSDAKSFLTGILPLALERSDGVVATLLAMEHFDLGIDYLDRYPAIINALTREQLLAAAQIHLDPARLAVAVAGPGSGG